MKKEQILILIGLLIMELMVSADFTGVTVMLPTFMKVFGIPEEFAGWIMVAYLAPFALLLIPMGYLADRYRAPEKMIISSILAFCLTSALCGLAPNEQWLIAFRIIKGIAAAGMFACEFAIILKYWAEPRRTVELVITGIAVGVLAGPALGGLFSTPELWRYFFFVSSFLALIGFFLYLPIRGLTPVERQADQVDISQKNFGGKFKLLLGLIAWGLVLDFIISLANQGTAVLITLEIQENQQLSPLFNSGIMVVISLGMVLANALGIGSKLFKELKNAVIASGALIAASLVVLSTLTSWSNVPAFVVYFLFGMFLGIFIASIELMALDPLPTGLLAQGNGCVVASMQAGHGLASFLIPLGFASFGTATSAYVLASLVISILIAFLIFGRKKS